MANAECPIKGICFTLKDRSLYQDLSPQHFEELFAEVRAKVDFNMAGVNECAVANDGGCVMTSKCMQAFGRVYQAKQREAANTGRKKLLLT